MHIPTDAKLLDELKGMPIHQFSMNHFPDNGPVNMSLCRFQFDNEDEQRMLQQSALFTIGEHTGDVSLSGDFGAQGKIAIHTQFPAFTFPDTWKLQFHPLYLFSFPTHPPKQNRPSA